MIKQQFLFGGLVLALGWVSLTGCTPSTVEIHTAVAEFDNDLPVSWSAVEDTSAPDSLNGPAAAPLTNHFLDLIGDTQLRALVFDALESNSDLQASALRLAAAGELLTGSAAALWPYAEVGYSATRNNQSFDELGRRQTTSRQQLSLGISWDVDIWHRLADLKDADVAEFKAQAADFAAAKDALGARIVQAWIQAIYLQQALAVENERIAVLATLQDTIRRRYRLGIGSIDDLAAAKASSELAKANAAVLQGDLGQAIRAIEMLAGRIPRTQLAIPTTLPQVKQANTGYPASVLEQRPDIAAALLRLDAASAEASAAAKAMLPSLRLTGDVAKDSSSMADLLSAKTIWNVLGSLTQPVFDRGTLKARSSASIHALEAAWQDYRSTVIEALGEVEDHLSREKVLLKQRDHLDRALSESVRSTKVQEERYRRGLSSIMELMQARDQEMDTRRQVIAANGEILSNRISLALAIGAGFEEHQS